MAESFKSVDEYIEAAEPVRRASLDRLRQLIRRAVPDAQETIRHGMPWYEFKGMLYAFAAQKKYTSFYLLNGDVVERNRHLLVGLDVGKGCIKAKGNAEIPDGVVHHLLSEAVHANEQLYNDHC